MKAIETTFNTIAIALLIVVATLVTLFFAHSGEIKVYEKSVINNVAVPLHAMIDGKQHHLFENPNVILDISYNK